MTANWLDRNRTQLWRLGVAHREALVAQYMAMYEPTVRPPLHLVYEELIGEFQDARILHGPLPMDRYAQTEVVRGRPEITLNVLIDQMDGVKDAEGVRHVAAWHESIHIPVDIERRDLPPLTDLRSGLDGSTTSPLLCSASQGNEHRWSLHEQAIEAAALAAAIADADLHRCMSFLKFVRLAARGGDMGAEGWRLLGWIATSIGVNRTALRRYFAQHGLCRFVQVGGKPRLIGTQQPFRGLVCLEPATRTSVA